MKGTHNLRIVHRLGANLVINFAGSSLLSRNGQNCLQKHAQKQGGSFNCRCFFIFYLSLKIFAGFLQIIFSRIFNKLLQLLDMVAADDDEDAIIL